jgi:hypothetical protein
VWRMFSLLVGVEELDSVLYGVPDVCWDIKVRL